METTVDSVWFASCNDVRESAPAEDVLLHLPPLTESSGAVHLQLSEGLRVALIVAEETDQLIILAVPDISSGVVVDTSHEAAFESDLKTIWRWGF